MKTLTTSRPLLVKKSGDSFLPLFSREEVSRDKFMHLRKDLISLGCGRQEAIRLAKALSMHVLNMENEENYLEYIMNHTYNSCKELISKNYLGDPIQDLNHADYSHVQLFSSIYKFELDYLKSKNAKNGIADIGCGDGLFTRLLTEHAMQPKGYDIEIKTPHHDIPLNKIFDFEDITEPVSYVVLNHVLEHIYEHPNDFLFRMIQHFNSFPEKKLQAIIISLPIHLSINAHLASNHKWICYSETIPPEIKFHIARERIKLYDPDTELTVFAKENGYTVRIENKIGTYVIERIN